MTATAARHRVRRVVSGVTAAAVVAVVVAVLLIAVGRLTGAFDVVVVLSGSMHPALQTGDVVVLVDRDASDMQLGDVLAFTPPTNLDQPASTLTLHRAVAIDTANDGNPVMRTQGDANASADRWAVPLDGSVEVAEVTRRVPLAGHVLLWSQSRYGRLTLYGTAVLLLAGPTVGWLRRRWSDPPSDAAHPRDPAVASRSDDPLFEHAADSGGDTCTERRVDRRADSTS